MNKQQQERIEKIKRRKDFSPVEKEFLTVLDTLNETLVQISSALQQIKEKR